MRARSGTYIENGNIILTVHAEGLYSIVGRLSPTQAHHVIISLVNDEEKDVSIANGSVLSYNPLDQGEPMIDYKVGGLSIVLRGDELRSLVDALSRAMDELLLIETEKMEEEND